jgi:hypothetical protein
VKIDFNNSRFKSKKMRYKILGLKKNVLDSPELLETILDGAKLTDFENVIVEQSKVHPTGDFGYGINVEMPHDKKATHLDYLEYEEVNETAPLPE